MAGLSEQPGESSVAGLSEQRADSSYFADLWSFGWQTLQVAHRSAAIICTERLWSCPVACSKRCFPVVPVPHVLVSGVITIATTSLSGVITIATTRVAVPIHVVVASWHVALACWLLVCQVD